MAVVSLYILSMGVKMSMQAIDFIREKTHKIIDWILAVLLVPTVIGTFVQVVLRYGAHKTIPQLNELATIMFVWLSILAAAKVLDKENHPAFTVLLEKAPGKIRDFICLVNWLIIFGILAVVIKGSLRLVESGRTQTLSTINASYIWVYASLLVGSLFMMIISAFKIIEIVAHILHRGGEHIG